MPFLVEIENPHYLHADIYMELLSILGSGMPVLDEKPMASTVEEAEAMVKTANTNGIALQVGLISRFCNGARLVKKAIDEGWLGEPQSFSYSKRSYGIGGWWDGRVQ